MFLDEWNKWIELEKKWMLDNCSQKILSERDK